MVYFTEKLINEIRARSCIWDTGDMNHLNKEMLANMWREIAENLYSDWHTLSVIDRRDRMNDVKKKWTNIKDSFVKDVKGKKTRDFRGPVEHKRKYYLFDHLQFLLPFIQDTKKSEDGTKSKNPYKKMRKIPRTDGPPPPPPPSSTMATAAVMAGGSGAARLETTVRAAALKPEVPADVQRHVDLLADVAGKPAADALCQLDGDLSFMVSLLPSIKSMDEKEKINFKIGVLQLVARIKFDNQQHPSPTDLACFPSYDCSRQATVEDGPPFPVELQPSRYRNGGDRGHRRNPSRSCASLSLVKQEVTVDSSPTSYFFVGDTDPEDNDNPEDVDDPDV